MAYFQTFRNRQAPCFNEFESVQAPFAPSALQNAFELIQKFELELDIKKDFITISLG